MYIIFTYTMCDLNETNYADMNLYISSTCTFV